MNPDDRGEPIESLFDTEPSPQPPPAGAAEGARAGPAARPVADDIEHPLDPKYIVLHRIIGAVITLIVALNVVLGGLIMLVAAPMPLVAKLLILVAGFIFVIVLGWFGQIWPAIEHRHMSYRVNDVRIEIRKGVVFRRVITVPRSRIQHTDVAQGPLERRFGLARLVIFTAGTEHSKVELPGLAHDLAVRVRDHLVVGGEDDAV